MDLSLTSTRPYTTSAWASNIYNLFIPNPSFQAQFYVNHPPVSLRSQLTTHRRYISIMVFECCHNFRNQPVSTIIQSPSSFGNITMVREHQHFGKILKYVFSYVFQDSFIHNIDTPGTSSICTYKNEFRCTVATSFLV